jgi:hypothetical protein
MLQVKIGPNLRLKRGPSFKLERARVLGERVGDDTSLFEVLDALGDHFGNANEAGKVRAVRRARFMIAAASLLFPAQAKWSDDPCFTQRTGGQTWGTTLRNMQHAQMTRDRFSPADSPICFYLETVRW